MHVQSSESDVAAETLAQTVILAAIDATEVADEVIEVAAHLAKLMRADLHLVHVYLEISLPTSGHGGPGLIPPGTSKAFFAGRELLESKVAMASRRAQLSVKAHLLGGSAWRGVLQLAVDLDADLLVVGTHEYKGLERLMIGSVADLVVRKASCPVYVVRPKRHAHAAFPDVEPSCVDCLRVQTDSARGTLWCAPHGRRYPHGYIHYQHPQGFAPGALSFRSE